ncbi:hypothetical protein GCM10017687_14320 [Streptomyces echinatus]
MRSSTLSESKLTGKFAAEASDEVRTHGRTSMWDPPLGGIDMDTRRRGRSKRQCGTYASEV